MQFLKNFKNIYQLLSKTSHTPSLLDIKDYNLAGNFLIATPSLKDKRFQKTVIYICIHNKNGAIGLVVNRFIDRIQPTKIFAHLLKKHEDLKIEPKNVPLMDVFDGGPMEKERAFIIHTHQYKNDDTLVFTNNISVTGNEKVFLDIIRPKIKKKPTFKHKLILGYAAWVPNQLEKELAENFWIIAPAREELIFHQDTAELWENSLKKFNISPALIANHVGHA